ncbi:MAG: MFS transporter [Caldilineaceae bacterium]|nr:MFS transporter [Caldilineaceae bacterium]
MAFKQWRTLPRNVQVMAAVSFLTDLSTEMIVNLLPLFLANVLGARLSLVGLIEGLAEAVSSLLKIVAGWLSDRLGKRKALATFGYAVSTVAKPFLVLVTSWTGVLAVRVAERFGKGVRTAPRDALLADSIDETKRGLAFGFHRAADSAGAVAGILVAILVVWLTQQSATLLTRVTFQWLVVLSVIPAILAVLLLIVGVREIQAAPQHNSPRLRLTDPGGPFVRFIVVIVLFTLGNSSDSFLVLRAQERGASVVNILVMLLSFNLVYTVVAGPAGALSDRVGRRRVLLGGWALYALIYLGFALARAGWQVWLLFTFYGVYYGTVEGAARAYVADIVMPAQRGTAYGIYYAAVGLSALPASIIAGVLWQGIGAWSGLGPSAPFLFGSMMALLAIVLFRLTVPTHAGATAMD